MLRLSTTKNCVFCGSAAKLSKEHVFGAWLNRIWVSRGPAQCRVGPLNRSPNVRDIGQPFSMTVRDVCEACNNGWLSRLEEAAKRSLSPLIHGKPNDISAVDQSTVATWAYKTALVNMLVSSEEQRENGYGLPLSEYRDLYEVRELQRPPTKTRFWIGRYQSDTMRVGACVTPMVVKIAGLAEPERPQAYIMTIVLGEVLLFGIRFTAPAIEFDVLPEERLRMIWPASKDLLQIPVAAPFKYKELLDLQKGRGLKTNLPGISIAPWRSATALPDSVLDGQRVRLPTPCGKHIVYYPAILWQAAQRGLVSSFITACECGRNYFVRTEVDGAHFKAEGQLDEIIAMYDAAGGIERKHKGKDGVFVFKQ